MKCSNDGPQLTMPYFMARSSLTPNAFNGDGDPGEMILCLHSLFFIRLCSYCIKQQCNEMETRGP